MNLARVSNMKHFKENLLIVRVGAFCKFELADFGRIHAQIWIVHQFQARAMVVPLLVRIVVFWTVQNQFEFN